MESIEKQLQAAQAAIKKAKEILNAPRPFIEIENLETGEKKKVFL
jgi:hypothetical protein